MSHLLDTSAWLAHLFGEPGVEEVSRIFEDAQSEVFVSVLSLPEMYGRLKALDRQDQWPLVRDTYAELFARCCRLTSRLRQQPSTSAAAPSRACLPSTP